MWNVKKKVFVDTAAARTLIGGGDKFDDLIDQPIKNSVLFITYLLAARETVSFGDNENSLFSEVPVNECFVI